jgi:hypothetical protein
MKPRELHTVHDVIVTDYAITRLAGGRAIHSFHPATTATVYEFEGNESPVLKEGARYNIGYIVAADGRHIVEPSVLSPSDKIDPLLSFYVAKQYGFQQYDLERANNDQRVSHAGDDDYYWGKKYAWRMFGACIPKTAFYAYLKEIRHPAVPCVTSKEGYPPSNSTAYAEQGLEQVVFNLITSAIIVGNGPYYRSPLFSKKFTIEGVSAITHKK